MSIGVQTHGLSRSRIYKIYMSMKNRCTSDYSGTCKYYKDRGITVCDEWLGENGFINFYIWSMDHGYKDNLTIDRIDVNGNYEPSNC